MNALEHRNSTVIHAPRESTETRAGYLEWLSTAAHEYFHAWNVKRLRPVELGPFDYENEVYTKSLWFVEGVTATTAICSCRVQAWSRPGISWGAFMGNPLPADHARAARAVRGDGIVDASIKYYRQDEDTSQHVPSATTSRVLSSASCSTRSFAV